MASVVVVVAAVSIAGCGGSDDDSDGNATTAEVTQLSAAQFRTQAAAICQRVVQEVTALGGPKGRSVEASRTYATARGAAQDAGLRALAAIAPPEAQQPSYEALLETLRARRTSMERAQVKSAAEDPSGRQDVLDYGRQQPQLDRLTAELRLKSCNWQ